MNNCAIRLPSKDDKWLEFKNIQIRKDFLLSFTRTWSSMSGVLRRTKPTEKEDAPYTYQQHEVFSGYYVRCSYDDALSIYRFSRGEDCVA
ncbi:hypothetical protein P5V15_015524 [Pogonomyrmex californicus]